MLELVALSLLGAHLGGEPARHLAHRRLTVLLGQDLVRLRVRTMALPTTSYLLLPTYYVPARSGRP